MTPVPFIVGVGRSGTTLLRLMLDAHPELSVAYFPHRAELVKVIPGYARAGDLVLTLGGGEMHSRVSGVTDHLAESDGHAIAITRDIVAHLGEIPAQRWMVTPPRPPRAGGRLASAVAPSKGVGAQGRIAGGAR